jgi:branched-chain amino acid aminotransferase
MNLFIYWTNDKGQKELVTAPLNRGDILPGVTRDSILALTREWGEFNVSERTVSMREIKKAATDGRLIEIFGSGTAAIISPVQLINYHGEVGGFLF